MSAPAQKALSPAPVITTAWIAGLFLIASNSFLFQEVMAY